MRAIPTVYAGVEFRSRLEARWAATFTELGWGWDYEPIDFRGWTPDFLVEAGSLGRRYAEVKPAHTFDELARLAKKIETSSFRGVALALGVGPFDDGKTIGALVHCDNGPGRWERATLALGISGEWREGGNLTQWKPERDSVFADTVDAPSNGSEWWARTRAVQIRRGAAIEVAEQWAEIVGAVAVGMNNAWYPGVLAGAHHVSIENGFASISYRRHSIHAACLNAAFQQRIVDAVQRWAVTRLAISILPDEAFA
jgi:hypothetical protein